jgi:regulatory protein
MGYPFERAWAYALWLLGRQARSRAQLRDKLRRKGADEAIIAEVLRRLDEQRLLDDAALAEQYVTSRSRQKGPLALRLELQRKGIAEADIEAALAGLTDEEQLTAARALLAKHAWRFRGEAEKRRAKAYAFLRRRGFAGDVIEQALATGLPTED